VTSRDFLGSFNHVLIGKNLKKKNRDCNLSVDLLRWDLSRFSKFNLKLISSSGWISFFQGTVYLTESNYELRKIY